MNYPAPPYPAPYRAVRPPLSPTNLWISVTALVATVLMGAAGAVLGLFSLAFLDYCPPETCSAEGAASAVLTSLVVAGLVGVIGLIVSVVQLVRRKLAWPFAVATLVICGVVLIGGVVGYVSAVGMGTASTQ